MVELALHERIAARALAYVNSPSSGPDPVVRLASPAELTDAFAASVGLDLDDGRAHGEDAVLGGVDQVIASSVHTSHARFVNQNFAGPDPVAVVGDWLGAALNTTNATYEVAPVFTMMERAVLRRLADLAGFPAAPDGPAPGLFCAGGSLAGLMALQLARHRHDPDIVRRGSTGRPAAVFVSASGHYSAEKNAAVLGIGSDGVVKVATDEAGAMQPDALRTAIGDARAAGRQPLAVIATAGTTVTAAFDPLDPIADICAAEDLWLHVDGCYGGSALFSPDQAWRLAGSDRADSMVWNLHKMMGMTQQCTALLVRDPAQLRSCFATGADYLFQPDKEHGELDAGDATIMCGRRVDVLKLWLAWKARGDAGFAARVDHAVTMADRARDRITADGDLGLQIVVAGDFTNVCFLWVPPDLRPLDPATLDDVTRARLHRVAPAAKARLQAEGAVLMGQQPVHDINCFRLIVMNPAVTPGDVDAMLEAVAGASAAAWADLA